MHNLLVPLKRQLGMAGVKIFMAIQMMNEHVEIMEISSVKKS